MAKSSTPAAASKAKATKKTNPTKPKAPKPKAPAKRRAKGEPGGKSDDEIQAKILNALADVRVFEIAEVPNLMVAKYTGFNSTDTKSYRRNVKALKDAGVILATSGATSILSLTEAGQAKCNKAQQEPMTNAQALERLEHVLEMFGTGTKAFEVCKLLSDGQARSREWMAKQFGVSTDTKSFRDSIPLLKKLPLIEELGNKTFKLLDVAFPEGRP
ncbi:hypothetical protein MPSEU_000322200 [Mayamaea pseudoterrestris]|nr:hypothetical protein MPSEU_000322200 [Mayamaea pseudoterrestris]